MGARMLKKGLAVAVILLFIGLAVAPTINADIESIENESVNLTIESCGTSNSKSKTVQMTKEQVEQLDAIFYNLEEKLNYVKTKEESIPIFDEALFELDKLDLLPDGMSLEEARKLVIGNYNQKRVLNILDTVIKQNNEYFGEDENMFCLIAGRVFDVYFSTLWFLYWYNLMYDSSGGGFWPFTFGLMLVGAIISSLTLINIVGLIYFADQTNGTIITAGLLGIKTWNGGLTGILPEWLNNFYPDLAVSGFSGIRFLSLQDDTPTYFIGTALRVGIQSD